MATSSTDDRTAAQRTSSLTAGSVRTAIATPARVLGAACLATAVAAGIGASAQAITDSAGSSSGAVPASAEVATEQLPPPAADEAVAAGAPETAAPQPGPATPASPPATGKPTAPGGNSDRGEIVDQQVRVVNRTPHVYKDVHLNDYEITTGGIIDGGNQLIGCERTARQRVLSSVTRWWGVVETTVTYADGSTKKSSKAQWVTGPEGSPYASSYSWSTGGAYSIELGPQPCAIVVPATGERHFDTWQQPAETAETRRGKLILGGPDAPPPGQLH